MKSPILYYILAFILTGMLLFMSACKDDVKIDDSAPKIRVTTPFENGEYLVNDKFVIKLEVTDDIDLKELTLRMHDNSVPHLEDATPSSFFGWDTTINMNVTGTKTDLEFEVPLPPILSSVSNYHLVAMSVDKSGNQTKWEEIPFKLVLPFDNVPPTIKLTSSSPIATSRNEKFTVMAEITDDVLLDEVRLTLRDANGIVYSEKIIDNTQINGASYILNQFIVAPIISGEYSLEISTKDKGGNKQSLLIIVKVF